jgi:hypothetical protein
VERWEHNQEVAVRFFGYTDEPPVTDFDFVSFEGFTVMVNLGKWSRCVMLTFSLRYLVPHHRPALGGT